jgi:Protein of unknown function (DUF3500)
MTDTEVLSRQFRRAPPRVDEGKLSQPLQDLFATWRQSLQQDFRGLTANGEVMHDLFPLGAAGASAQPLNAAVKDFLSSLDVTGLPDEFGEFFYWISIFGTPSQDRPSAAPWGFQIDGHHCNINCFVLGDQVVLTPMLLGSEPVLAESGKYKGITVLREEEAQGFALMSGLTTEQRAKATIGYDLPFDGFASGFKDNVVIPYDGLCAPDMTPAQQASLLDLIRLYTDRLPAAHAQLRLNEVTRYLGATIFAWIGQFDPVAPFYYRIYSPVIFVEFYHQPGVALPNTGYNRRHAHALVRTPNGNDYGRALLRQYLARTQSA